MRDESREREKAAPGRRFLLSAFFSFIPHPSSLTLRLSRALRGEIDARTVALETLRRSRVALEQRRERARLDELNERPARLRAPFARMPGRELLEHFRNRTDPKFFPGFTTPSTRLASLQRELFRLETADLLAKAERIRDEHRWALLGFEEQGFGSHI